jgi:hypothetical protein
MQPVTDPELLRILNGGGAAPAGGPVYGPAPTPTPAPAPKTTYRTLTRDEVATRGLNPARAYQESSEGKVDDLGELPESALPAADRDPERGTQIRTILGNIETLRGLSDDTLAVGTWSGRVGEWPVVGPALGQNRANVEGALQMVQGDLVQQQIARLNAAAGGKGVASLANSETEAARMAASIANLDPNQDLTNFTAGLDRAEQYYKRALARELGLNPDDPAVLEQLGAKPEGSQAGSVPRAVEGGGIPGVREPTQQEVFSNGVQWDADQTDAQDSQAGYLSRKYGVDPGEEAAINAFWNANLGNAELSVEGVREWYRRRGIGVPKDEDIAVAIEAAQKPGVTFEGSGTENAIEGYNQQLDQVLDQRGRDPESTSGTIGAKAAQGIMLGGLDEMHGLVGAAVAPFQGQNPVTAYQAERDVIRREQERAETANPKTALASEIVSSLPTGGIGFARTGRLSQLAQQASRMGNTARATTLGREAVTSASKAGAATGAAVGFNYGEGPVGSTVGAGGGATLGALAAAGMQAGAPYIAKGVNSLAGMVKAGAGGRGAATTAAEAGSLEASTGIPIMTSDALPPQTFMSKGLQALGERIPLLGTGGKRAAQQESRREAAENLLRDYGGMDSPAAIDSVMADLTQQRGAALTQWTGVKDGIKAQLQGRPVPTTRLTAAIDQNIAALRSRNDADLDPIIQRLTNWRTAAQGQGIDNIESLRRKIGDALADPSLAHVKGDMEKVSQALYGPLRADIAGFVEQTLGRAEAGKWNVANRRLSVLAGELKSGRLRNVLNTGDITPENVGNLLFSSKPSEIAALYRGLSAAGKANARAAIMQRVFGKFGNDAEQITPEKFLTALNSVSKPMGIFFEGADAMRVQGLVRALQLTRRAGQAGVSTPTGQQTIPILMGISIPVTGGASAALGTAIGISARIYESAAVRNLLLGLSRTKPGSPQEAGVYQNLEGVVARLAASNDNTATAVDALAQSPSRAAAAEQEQN